MVTTQRFHDVLPHEPLFEVTPHHCAFSVPDLESSIVWYRDMLGFTLEMRMIVSEFPMTIAMLQRRNFRIELFEVPGAKPLPDNRRDLDDDLRTHGTKHLALNVRDVRAALAALKDRRVDVARDVFEIDNVAACFIRDNAGNLIELIQWPSPE